MVLTVKLGLVTKVVGSLQGGGLPARKHAELVWCQIHSTKFEDLPMMAKPAQIARVCPKALVKYSFVIAAMKEPDGNIPRNAKNPSVRNDRRKRSDFGKNGGRQWVRNRCEKPAVMEKLYQPDLQHMKDDLRIFRVVLVPAVVQGVTCPDPGHRGNPPGQDGEPEPCENCPSPRTRSGRDVHNQQ